MPERRDKQDVPPPELHAKRWDEFPVTTYTVTAAWSDGEESEPYDTEEEARDAAKMCRSGGALIVQVERVVTSIDFKIERTVIEGFAATDAP